VPPSILVSRGPEGVPSRSVGYSVYPFFGRSYRSPRAVLPVVFRCPDRWSDLRPLFGTRGNADGCGRRRCRIVTVGLVTWAAPIAPAAPW